MKSLVRIILFLMSIMTGYAQTFNVQFTVSKFLPGKKETVYLSKYYGENFAVIDSAVIERDTTILFKLPAATDGLYSVKSKSEKENQAEFIVNKKEGTLKLEAEHYQLLNGETAILDSPENSAYAQLLELRRKYDQDYHATYSRLNGLSVFIPTYKTVLKDQEETIEQFDAAINAGLDAIATAFPATYTAQVLVPVTKTPLRSMNPGWAAYYDGFRAFLHAHFFYFIDMNDPRLLAHYAFTDKISEYLALYNEKTSDGTKQGIDLLMASLKENDEVNSFVYNSLLKTFIKYKNDVLVKYITDKHPNGCSLELSMEDLQKLMSMKATTVGGKAPDILLYDVNGKVQSLYEQCAKNKLTVLVFWISWCNRCQRETPEIEKLYQHYKKQGMGLFAVSADETKEEWLKGLAENKMSGINVSELVPLKQSKVLPLYSISNTPTLFLLNKDAVVMDKNVFGDKLEAAVAAQLKK